MITHLTTSGIKNSDYSGPIVQVQLLTGPNRTGKTAVSESLRLALTNDAEIGGTPAKQSLLVASTASVHASGGGVECVWSYEGGKRKHLLTFDGMDVKSLQGGLPVTVPEFWALTGDERWGLLEGVVGKFTLSAPQDPAPLKTKIKDLKNQPQPEAYTASPIAEVQAELNEVLTEIARQANIRSSIEEAKAHNAKVQAARDSTHRSLQEATRRYTEAKANAAKIDAEYGSLAHDLFEWAISPSTILDNRTIGECTRKVWEEFEPKLKALGLAGSAWAEAMISRAPLAADIEDGTLIVQCEAVLRVQDKMKQLGFSPKDYLFPNQANAAVMRAVEEAKDEVLAAKEGVEAVQQHYDLAHSTELKPETALDMATYSTLLGRRDSLQATVQSAAAWTNWAVNVEKSKQQIDELESQLKQLEQQHAAYQMARASYLGRAIATIEDRANAVLSEMNWPTVSVKIDQAGKRNTLTLNAGGVDVAAMSGGEALVYGTAVLNAIQEGSAAKCPLLIIEAAELDAKNLLAFATAVRSNRTKGNVVIASHVAVDFDGALSL